MPLLDMATFSSVVVIETEMELSVLYEHPSPQAMYFRDSPHGT